MRDDDLRIVDFIKRMWKLWVEKEAVKVVHRNATQNDEQQNVFRIRFYGLKHNFWNETTVNTKYKARLICVYVQIDLKEALNGNE